MFTLLLLVTLPLSPVQGCDIVHNTGVIMDYTSMEWLNNVIESWYTVNNDKVHLVVKEVLERELNNVTPDIIEKIVLEECTFGTDTPKIRGIKSRIVESKCMSTAGKQQKVVVDLVVSIDAPDFEFKLGVKVPLLTLRAAVQRLMFIGNLRVTATFSDQIAFPGVKNLCVTFTDRPELGFNVELLNVIDIDTFGVDQLIADAIEDILAKQLVYPGRLYVDLSNVGTGGKVEVVMMPRISDQHPGVVTTKVTLSRITQSSETTKIDVLTKLGANEEHKVVELTTDERVVAHNYLIEDFDANDLLVKIFESRLIFKDIQYGAVKVDLADMEFTLPSVTETFTNTDKNVKIVVEVKAYLLPLLALKQEGEKVVDMQERFGAACSSKHGDLNTGVLYVHVHSASGIPNKEKDSTKSDPFVTVYLNQKQILKTSEVTNSHSPVFNEWTEVVVEEFGGAQLIFKLDDNDVWPNTDDPIGSVAVSLNQDYTRVVDKPLKLETKQTVEEVILNVSVIFRPLPLV